jgi:hypothetical protein
MDRGKSGNNSTLEEELGSNLGPITAENHVFGTY